MSKNSEKKEEKTKIIEEKPVITQDTQEENTFLEDLQRVQAEFENYIKRVEREKERDILNVKSELLLKIINVKEDLERVLKNNNNEALKMIYNNIMKILNEEKIIEIKTVKEKFDHNLHEVVKKIDGKEDEILDVIQRGYTIGDKILRTSKVVIGGKNGV